MENPATWSKATWVVINALVRHRALEDSEVVGLSLPAMIVQALRDAGYLTAESLELPDDLPIDSMPNK